MVSRVSRNVSGDHSPNNGSNNSNREKKKKKSEKTKKKAKEPIIRKNKAYRMADECCICMIELGENPEVLLYCEV